MILERSIIYEIKIGRFIINIIYIMTDIFKIKNNISHEKGIIIRYNKKYL